MASRHGDQFEAARKKYESHVRNKSKTVGMTPVEYKATHTALYSGEAENVSPSILNLRRETDERKAKLKLVQDGQPTGLPASDAEIEIHIREPRGEWRLKIVVPNIGTLLGAESRHQRGYLDVFLRGLAYALTGECR